MRNSSLPPKEDMEKLLPSSWPPRWEEINRYAKDGLVIISLTHINPDPENEVGVTFLKSGFGLTSGMMSLKPVRFDFVGHLSIAGYGDEQTAKQFFESYQTIPAQGLSAPTPGASVAIPLGDLIKVFAPKEMVKEMSGALDKFKEGFSKSGIKIEKGKYLGEEALFHVDKDGKRWCSAILIDNFVITGILLMSDAFELGSKRIHAIKCKRSDKHPPCSTLKAEGFLHKEEVEQINRSVFSRIKGRDECPKGCFKTEEEAIKNVRETVVPRKCFVWKDCPSKKCPWRVIPGTGCAHWVAHQLNLQGKVSCKKGYLIRVKDVIKGEKEVNFKDAKMGDIWTDEDETHIGIVRAVMNDKEGVKVEVEHDSDSVRGVGMGVIKTWFMRGKIWR